MLKKPYKILTHSTRIWLSYREHVWWSLPCPSYRTLWVGYRWRTGSWSLHTWALQLTVSCRISGCHAMNLKKMSNRVRGKCKCRLRCVSLFIQCSIRVYVGCSTWSVILFIYIFCTNFCILILFLNNIFVYWYYF